MLRKKYLHIKNQYGEEVYEKFILVARMDNIIREDVSDEDLIFLWLMAGCPDASDEEDYLWFATEPGEYEALEKLFFSIIEQDNE